MNEAKVSSLKLSCIKLRSRTLKMNYVEKLGELIIPRTSCLDSHHPLQNVF
jgi:hypothetical protein